MAEFPIKGWTNSSINRLFAEVEKIWYSRRVSATGKRQRIERIDDNIDVVSRWIDGANTVLIKQT